MKHKRELLLHFYQSNAFKGQALVILEADSPEELKAKIAAIELTGVTMDILKREGFDPEKLRDGQIDALRERHGPVEIRVMQYGVEMRENGA